MKSAIIITFLFLNAGLGWFLFVYEKPNLVMFKNANEFNFREASLVSVSNSNKKGGNGFWYFFSYEQKMYAFEDEEVSSRQKYYLKMEYVTVGSRSDEVVFCYEFNLLEYIVGRMVIMTFFSLLYLSFCGWIVQKMDERIK